MTPISDTESGRLLEAVDDLKEEVRRLRVDVDGLKTTLDRGRGIIAGLLLAAGGVGALIKGLIGKS
ncbi:MAG: hypothetical protein GY835_05765 [bacterium]|nr:hypothetical protein [bacterium]MCP4545957.1 hypothetical protein [bacterium]